MHNPCKCERNYLIGILALAKMNRFPLVKVE